MSADPKRLNDLAAIASIAVAAILVVAKLAIWIATGSVAILGSLVDSGMDALASVVTLVSIRQAAQPPDRAHRYGHGKAEAIGAFVQAGFVLGSAFFLANEAARRLLSPQPLEQSALGIAVLLLASLLTAALLGFQRYVVRRTGSIAIRADSLHYRSDLLMNLAVIAILVLTEATGSMLVDPLFGLALVLVLLFSAFAVARRALDMLMDRELPSRRSAPPSAHSPSSTPRRMACTTCAPGAPARTCSSSCTWSCRASSASSRRTPSPTRSRHGSAPRFPDADIIVHQEPAGLEGRAPGHADRRARGLIGSGGAMPVSG